MKLTKYLIALIALLTFTRSFSQNDCTDAIIVCGNTGFEGLNATGIGIQELSGSNTCNSEENNSIWLKISINTGGTLGFTLTPESDNIGVDFDFFIFGPDVTCSSLGMAIRCSTTNPSDSGAVNNHTGLEETETDTSEGPGRLGNNFVSWLTVNDGETYFVVIDRPIGSSNFSLTWTGTATFNQPPTFQTPTGTALDIESCDNDILQDNSTNFNLAQNTPIITGAQTSVAVTYHTDTNDAITGENPIPDPTAFPNTENPQTIFARITNTVTGCFATTEFTIEVINSVTIPNDSSVLCDDATDGDDQNGQTTFIMADVTNDILAGEDLTGLTVNYYPSLTDAQNNTLPFGATHYNTTPNEETVFIRVANPDGCFKIKEIKLTVNPLPAKVSTTLTQCDTGLNPDGLTLFNLNQAIQSLTNNDPNLGVQFFESGNTTPLPINYQNTSNPQAITAQVTNLTTGCSSISNIILNVNVINRTVTIDPQCDTLGNENGFRSFDLNTTDLVLTPTETARFYNNLNDALLEQNEITNIGNYTNLDPYNATIYVRIEDANSCSGISQIRLTVYPLPQIETEDTDYICTNLPDRYTTLDAGLLQGVTSDYAYNWSTGQHTPTIRVNEAGIYTVEVTNRNGCSKTRTITVEPSNNATIQEVVIVDLVDNNTVTVLLAPESIGDYYQYSLDLSNGPFQDSNYFENVAPGFHTVYVYDTHGCGIVNKKISVLRIPAYFTPNADGIHDTWDIIGINPQFYSNSKIYIFDRFGKLLADVDPKGAGWDGNYNGRALPANDYWYLVTLDNGRTVRGHFSLLR